VFNLTKKLWDKTPEGGQVGLIALGTAASVLNPAIPVAALGIMASSWALYYLGKGLGKATAATAKSSAQVMKELNEKRKAMVARRLAEIAEAKQKALLAEKYRPLTVQEQMESANRQCLNRIALIEAMTALPEDERIALVNQQLDALAEELRDFGI